MLKFKAHHKEITNIKEILTMKLTRQIPDQDIKSRLKHYKHKIAQMLVEVGRHKDGSGDKEFAARMQQP